MSENLSSAAVVIGALRVNTDYWLLYVSSEGSGDSAHARRLALGGVIRREISCTWPIMFYPVYTGNP